MRRREKAAKIVQILEELYPEVPIPLDHGDPFTLLVAVMLSAQTTDKKVNQVTPALFAAARTPEAMAALPVETIQTFIREIGLAPTKAKNLRRLSQQLVDEHEGIVPATMSQLLKLPGVGRKTANVVLSQALEIPGFPVDRHVIRVVNRLGLVCSKDPVVIETELCAMLPPSCWANASSTLIAHGRRICKPRPICSKCSIRNKCPWMRESGESLA